MIFAAVNLDTYLLSLFSSILLLGLQSFVSDRSRKQSFRDEQLTTIKHTEYTKLLSEVLSLTNYIFEKENWFKKTPAELKNQLSTNAKNHVSHLLLLGTDEAVNSFIVLHENLRILIDILPNESNKSEMFQILSTDEAKKIDSNLKALINTLRKDIGLEKSSISLLNT